MSAQCCYTSRVSRIRTMITKCFANRVSQIVDKEILANDSGVEYVVIQELSKLHHHVRPELISQDDLRMYSIGHHSGIGQWAAASRNPRCVHSCHSPEVMQGYPTNFL